MKSRSFFVVLLLLFTVGCFTACGDSPTQPTQAPPTISLFTVEPGRVVLGLNVNNTYTLRWEVLDQDAAVRIDPLPGNVPHIGTHVVSPTTVGTFSYTITARNAFGTTQRFVSVVVN